MLSIQDFLTNPEFVEWVKNPTKQLDDYWTKWIKANPDQLSTLKLAREFLMRVQYNEIRADEGTKEQILTDLLKTPSRKSDSSSTKVLPLAQPNKKTNYFNLSQLHRIAAILILGLGLAWLLIPSEFFDISQTHLDEIATLTKFTQPGEKLRLTLKDGTKIWMNAATEIQFPERFDTLERRIVLTGEAYFEVAKDSVRPFIVETNGLSTTALGTSFNITTKNEGRIYVSLLSGKVKISSTSDQEDIFLDPGKELRYSTNDRKLQVRAFDIDQVMAWKEGNLVFEDATLLSVVKQLEDWYGVKIQIENGERIRWKYSAEYKNQTLEDVLNSLSYIQQFEYSLDGKQVKFKF
ncbi:FecR family protein [Lunatibacter salilacus]|uniref:FecR family protein n=1 Tax=Lunatibacter salilacus TaxID=2483804 RepID=UPI00131D1C38|nr:FecR family protein [Lunatibacter salilacus]